MDANAGQGYIVMLMENDDIIIQESRCWLETVVIANNFCPFAKRELDQGHIRFVVSHHTEIQDFLEALMLECEYLDKNTDIETTLLIAANAFKDFDDYLIMLELAQMLMENQGCEGIYQLASFHPDYCFDGSDNEDAANYTNRSPYPMLHLLRESSLEKALTHYDQPELIPENNINKARSAGLEQMKSQLQNCYQNKK